MSKVTIASANTGTKLEFLDVGNEYFTVEFSSPSLSAFHRVWMYAGDGERLASLFEEMAENWKGWEGVKIWDAIEGDFSLSCTGDKLGHITIKVKLVGRNPPQLWSVEFDMEIEAGQLETIAKETKLLFRGY
jgi:Family of unknown function (DUF6228)